jgi:catalase
MQQSVRSSQPGQEYPLLDEDAIFQEMGEIIEKLMIRNRAPVQRQQHAKHHGCAHATFEVEPNLPQELRVGLFKEANSYRAWIRFSNASQHIDTIANPHGFAIKLMGVRGPKALDDRHDDETQDFLMADFPIFIVRNAADYLDLFRAALNRPGKMPWSFFFPSLNPSKWRLRELSLIKKTRSLRIDSMLNTQYWTLGAFRFGSGAAKFSVRPVTKEATPEAAPEVESPDYLSERLAESLRAKSVQFEFLMQLQTDASTMPIEDTTVEWGSPFHRVAIITIPSQDLRDPEQMALAEHLSFTPWHALAEHRPLGGINRIRKAAYGASSAVRHRLNGVPEREPV